MPLRVEVEAGAVGFDQARLTRIDRHFERYVADGRLPGWLLLISRGGKVVHLSTRGHRDVEAGSPVETDTLFRIHSMTKPVTSVAAMMLYEDGAFDLRDPVSRFIPAFAGVRVFRQGTALRPVTVPATEPIRIWHLLTHTAGLTYGFLHQHVVDEMYRAAGFDWGPPPELDLATCCERWASLPLLFEPGTAWNYSVASDVLGRIVEIASGRSLDDFFAERILAPLGMSDTGFAVEPADASRLAALYAADPAGHAVRRDPIGGGARPRPIFLSGGGGLITSAGDYHRFTRMLLGAGQLDGIRLLSGRTVQYMGRNHLPGRADLETFGRPGFSETSRAGVGFGLGFAVVEDPVSNKVLSSIGELSWGGAASTAFWIDPAEQLIVLFLTQLFPSTTHPMLRSELRQLVYQALVD
ncbi:MAG TPA: serine hydrolase domain-containing protein [Candidatus Limnocylindria bacterium]|nr:serine hydrolase domain-containing protein [Candidatus Limnocylindria bacterium]